MVIEISLRLKHECPFLEFSTYFGRKSVHHYCNSINDYLVIPVPLTEERIILAYELFGRFKNLRIKNLGEPSKITYISMDCPRKYSQIENTKSLSPKLKELNAEPIYPITYQYGYEFYTIHCQNQNDANLFITKMSEFVELDVLYQRDIGNDWIISQSAVLKQLIEGLTKVQICTLLQAYEGGYYNIPRDIKIGKIAQLNGKSRYGVDKNLRIAENKILTYIIPFIYLIKANL